MPSRTRVVRGRATQRIATAYLLDVWPDAVSKEAFLPGVDITGTPGYRVECKATQDGTLTGAMSQCEKHPGDGTPIVIWRPDRYGPERVADWLVVMRLHDFKDLVKHG